jgi:ribosome-binding factor A
LSRRTERVDHQIRAELSLLIQREMSDPRVRLATVSEVHVSPDLRHAKVFVSAVGDDAAREACVTALRRGAGFLRRQLGSRLRLRATPELDFALDRGAEHSAKISALLETLHHADEQDDQQDSKHEDPT